MKAYEHTDYLVSLEAGTLLLRSSTTEDYVAYTGRDGQVLSYLPYLPPNCSLFPAEELLRETYPLRQFERLATALEKRTGIDCYHEILRIWTFAYYTGLKDFSSRDVYLVFDGNDFSMPPLFNYAGAFCNPCEYESIKPPSRAFQVNWHYFSQQRRSLCEQPPYIQDAIAHFTKTEYYR